MATLLQEEQKNIASEAVKSTVFSILVALSFTHLLNDTIQSLIPSIYPILSKELNLNFSQIGMITLTYQLTASILQPVVGLYTDKRPQPYSLAIGMFFTLVGILCLSYAHNFAFVLFSVALVGVGSSVFHPEASRMAHMAAGGKKGLAQSLFQVGGNAGSSLGPLLAAWIITPRGQGSIIIFSALAVLAIAVMLWISKWYKANLHLQKPKVAKTAMGISQPALPTKTVVISIGILLFLIFSKYFYMASMTSYYTFYLMDKFKVSVEDSQIYLFIFLFAIAAGTIIGGPVGDKIGRKYVIWISILGVAPFTLLLPYVGLAATVVLSVFIGVILSSAFSAILVYATELIPGKVGMVAGLFFGLAFGMGGIGSAVIGKLIDMTSLEYVYKLCSFLPLLGLLTYFLPNVEKNKA
ncbi:FSR family fosmidomycin resistance protein-like MFS transporter [Chitinophaga skermanii]|uniref:FSR family fosmidomycin resistance protein-like MFS transporter n=1 Tax=Chitinophaga skermanii TaxID=331697 RepID=A0A327R1L6_9BACT|nr:MFS transporter [Chitinophaga skermanii]RAJ10550.1 FSR family fosmidomycin resistance protein-like MFS transporter [Chitinophaga skermanii]